MTIEIAGKSVLITTPCTLEQVQATNSIYIAKKIGEGKVGGALIEIQGGWNVVSRADEKLEKTPYTVLQEAQGLVYGDRAASYGSATENFTRTAAGWAQILGVPVTAEQVGLMMVWLKISRQVHKPHRDNLVDAAGYIATVEKVQNGQ